MTNNFLIDNFKHLTTTPENVEQLKKLVLQLAVQGKLTEKWQEHVKTQNLASPDDPNYNASALLEKIKTEKEQLIKEGKIQKQKPLPVIADEEKPFELPENWEWVRLDMISNYGQSLKIEPKKIKEPNTWVLELEDIEKTTSRLLQKVRFKERKSKSTKSIFKKGDVLYGKLRPYLDKVIVADEDGVCTTEIIPIKIIGSLNPYFIRLTLKRSDYLSYVDTQVSGMRMPRLKTESARNALIPLPPIAEQKAIVSQVEKLFTQIDQLHTLAQKRINYREKSAKALFNKINHAENDTELQETWQTLTAHFHTLTQSKESVKQLRQSILQLAVQGKLSAKWRKENPDVEPASVLFERIKAENEEVKSKYSLRKQKNFLNIQESEKLFSIPNSWDWFRLGQLLFTTSGGTPTRGNTDYWDGEIPWLKSGELTDGLITLEAEEKITELGYKKSSTNLFPKDTLLIALYGATAGKLGILTYPSTTNQAICGFYANSSIETDYLFYYLWAFRSKILSDSWGQAQPNISQEYLKKFCFALPPHEEQKVIVTKVKQLMSWCDELEKKIEKRDTYQHKMMQAVVKQTFNTENKLK